MPDKLTDSEIVKALKCCISNKTCEEAKCPLYENGCEIDIQIPHRLALDLINRLQAENEVLEARIGVYETCNARKDEAIRGLEAENERLKKTVDIHKGIAEDWKHEAKKLQMVIDEVDDYIHPLPFETDYDKAIKQAKAEAYKEFAERLKEQKYQSSDWSHGEHPFVVEESDIDNLLKELVGDNDESTN